MFKNTKRKDIVENTFDIKIYFVVCIFFLLGVVIGTIYFRMVSSDVEIKNNLIEGLSLTKNYTSKELLINTLSKNVKTLILYWIVGISAVGSPFLLLYCCIKGASLAFAISTIIYKFGFIGGNLYTFGHLFLRSNLSILAVILLTVSSIKLTINTIKNKKDIRLEIVRHSVVSIISLTLFLLSSIVEMFFT